MRSGLAALMRDTTDFGSLFLAALAFIGALVIGVAVSQWVRSFVHNDLLAKLVAIVIAAVPATLLMRYGFGRAKS